MGGFLAGAFVEVVAPTPNLPAALAVASGVLGALFSFALDVSAMRLFLRKRTGIAPWQPSKVLVIEGPYRFSRNPMYLGMALLYAGLALAFGLLWALALLPLVIVIIDRAIIRREEMYLEHTYGNAYDDYRRRVRRWI
jgi:protein-S-isoprenylcysteine O-methyltransferase Ste14